MLKVLNVWNHIPGRKWKGAGYWNSALWTDLVGNLSQRPAKVAGSGDWSNELQFFFLLLLPLFLPVLTAQLGAKVTFAAGAMLDECCSALAPLQLPGSGTVVVTTSPSRSAPSRRFPLQHCSDPRGWRSPLQQKQYLIETPLHSHLAGGRESRGKDAGHTRGFIAAPEGTWDTWFSEREAL